MLRAVAAPIAFVLLVSSSAQLGAQPSPRSESARDSLSRALRVLREELGLNALAAADSFSTGNLTIPSGRSEQRPIGVYGGTLTVNGHVANSVVVVNGDLVLNPGARIDGDAIVVRGNLRRVGGAGVIQGASITLGGDLRSPGTTVPALTGMAQVRNSLGISLTTIAIALALGIGVLVFAGRHLTGTADTLAAHPVKSFLVGLVAQLAAMPTLVLLTLGLALTILGILLIPFAIVAFFLGALGIGALGLLATALVIGLAVSGKGARALPERRQNLRALIIGIFLLGSIWVLAALLIAVPMAGAAFRGFAVVMTWVAVSAGFGAAVISRAGQRARSQVPAAEVQPDISWQTPTPVSGVAAARRPINRSGSA